MRRLSVLLAVAVLMVFTSTAISGGDNNRGEIGKGGTNEIGCEDQPCFEDAPKPGTLETPAVLAADLTVDLDQTEVDHLVFIREEEKLARDVYLVLYERWGSPVFANIIESEQAHMDAMANLLNDYGIEDPVTSDAVGAFTDPAIGELFESLTDWGLQSESDAFLVGGFIEEYDILDLWKAYAGTDEERIRQVYQNLYEGSYNHLDAFAHNYASLVGDSYVPELLTGEEYAYVMDFVTQAQQTQEPRQKKGR